jgi:hypothetical protein
MSDDSPVSAASFSNNRRMLFHSGPNCDVVRCALAAPESETIPVLLFARLSGDSLSVHRSASNPHNQSLKKS